MWFCAGKTQTCLLRTLGRDLVQQHLVGMVLLVRTKNRQSLRCNYVVSRWTNTNMLAEDLGTDTLAGDLAGDDVIWEHTT
jgi:hypothetical protein